MKNFPAFFELLPSVFISHINDCKEIGEVVHRNALMQQGPGILFISQPNNQQTEGDQQHEPT